MKKEDTVQKKSISPILTEQEQVLADASNNFVSERLGQLWAAWDSDFRNVIFILGKHVKNQAELPRLGVSGSLSDILARLGKSLEYIVSDCEDLSQFEGEVGSYEYGLKCILNWAQIALCHTVGNDPPIPESANEVSRLLLDIQSCIISLIAQGYTQKAADLGHLAGACFCIYSHKAGEDENMLKEGSRREYWKDIDRLKILLFLHGQLAQGVIPTKKALRLSTFLNKDQSNFTGLLRGMAIQPLLPNEAIERNTLNKAKGTFHSGWFFHNQSAPAPGKENENEILTGWSLKPTGNSQTIDVEIKRIKQLLGPIYHLLLIRFGMPELESIEDLRNFEDCLAELGLGFN